MKKVFSSFAFCTVMFGSTLAFADGFSTVDPKSVFKSEIPTAPVFEGKEFRTLELLPGARTILPFEWGVPATYISKPMFPEKEFGTPLYDGIVWGTKDQLDNFLKDPTRDISKITTPIFIVKASSTVGQKDAENFTNEEKFEEELKKAGAKLISKSKIKWGPYPVLTIVMELEHKKIFFAYVGANYEGWVIHVDYRPPNREKPLSEINTAVWDNFLKNTRVLSEPWLSRVLGYDRYWGVTFVRTGEGFIYKVQAQKRIKDGVIGLRIDPLVESTSDWRVKKYSYESTEDSQIYGAPSATVRFKIDYENPKTPNHSGETFSSPAILLKEVAEFSLKGKPIKKDSKVTLYQ